MDVFPRTIKKTFQCREFDTDFDIRLSHIVTEISGPPTLQREKTDRSLRLSTGLRSLDGYEVLVQRPGTLTTFWKETKWWTDY